MMAGDLAHPQMLDPHATNTSRGEVMWMNITFPPFVYALLGSMCPVEYMLMVGDVFLYGVLDMAAATVG